MISRPVFRVLAVFAALAVVCLAAVTVSATQRPDRPSAAQSPASKPVSKPAPKPAAPKTLTPPPAIGPVAQPPGGVTATPTGTIMPSPTGTDIQYTNLDKTQFSALWWGPAVELAGSNPVAGLAFDGDYNQAGEGMTFAASQPDLAVGKEYWTGQAISPQSCAGTPCNPCTSACPTRLVITVTDPTGATPIPLVLATSVNGIPASEGAVAPVSGNFKVNLTMQMQKPGGGGAWSDPKTWYDTELAFAMADKDGKLFSTFDGGFYYLGTSFTAVKNQQYSLASSDGATWVELDNSNQVTVAPGFDQIAFVGGNVDLWTANAGYNQDVAIFVSDNGGADQLAAWKESGGFAGTFSPNAAFVQAAVPVTGGHGYTFKLKWKTNKNAAGKTIYAGAGPLPAPNPPQISPTRLTAKLVPAPNGTYSYDAVTNTQYSLANSNGSTWVAMDATNLKLTIAPAADSTALLGANVDLWTANAGYNQDIGIFVSDNGGADTIVGWKESGGFAGTFSPNAAYLQTGFAMTSGHTYVFKLMWKTNKNASGATIFAGAGPLPAPNPPQISPTRISALVFPASLPAYATASAVTNTQYSLQNSDGANWAKMDSTNLKLDITPLATTNAIVSANVDLWTATAGFNQDVAIFVAADSGSETLLAWKESGGFAGTFSPNAAFLQAYYSMDPGHTYHFTLQWKTNKSGSSTIFAGAGPLPSPPIISPTRLQILTTT